jgi:hypothetical protein
MELPVSAQQIVDLLRNLKFRLEAIEKRYERLQSQLSRLEGAYVRHVKETHRGWSGMYVQAQDAESLFGVTPDSLSTPPAGLRVVSPSPDPVISQQGVTDVQDQSVSSCRSTVA